MALILSLETSATACSVALHERGEFIDGREINEGQAHAAKLAILIDELFRDSTLAIKKLEAVAISSGPGSYTGLRIGTSTAKGLCFALNIPLIAINTLDLLAFQFLQTKVVHKALLCPMIDAKRMEVYCQVMNQDLATLYPVEAKVVEETSFNELLKEHPMFFFGDGAEKCRNVITHKNASFIEGIVPRALALGQMAFKKFSTKEIEDLVNFTPFYLKDFIAKKAQPIF